VLRFASRAPIDDREVRKSPPLGNGRAASSRQPSDVAPTGVIYLTSPRDLVANFNETGSAMPKPDPLLQPAHLSQLGWVIGTDPITASAQQVLGVDTRNGGSYVVARDNFEPASPRWQRLRCSSATR
jgi:hypothetical protein